MPNHAYILLGSNLGDSLQTLRKAMDEITRSAGKILRQSSFYRTAAWGKTNQNDFVNAVVLVQTNLTPQELLESLLRIETNMGRVRLEKWESRIIDLDILFYEDLIIKEPNLTLPHPYLHERKFTLVPLAEIGPDFIHPLLQLSVSSLLENCSDPLMVEKIREN